MADDYNERFFDLERILLEQESLFGLEESNDNKVEHEGPQLQQHQPKSRRQLNLQQKREIVGALLLNLGTGDVPRGFYSQLGVAFSVHRSTITRIVKDIKTQMAQGTVIDVKPKKFGKVGRKSIQYFDEWLISVPLYKRTTERAYAEYLKISHVTIHNLKKKGRLRTHTSINKPALTQNHKYARLKWVLSHLLPSPRPNVNPKYVNVQHVIHINEKWFYLKPETRRFSLLPKEENPYRCQQSKNFRVKAMFIGMIGKPMFAYDGTVLHNGKYGLWLLVYMIKAKRKSKNREARTEEIKPHQGVNREIIRDILLQKGTLSFKWMQIKEQPSCKHKDCHI